MPVQIYQKDNRTVPMDVAIASLLVNSTGICLLTAETSTLFELYHKRNSTVSHNNFKQVWQIDLVSLFVIRTKFRLVALY